MSLAGLDDPTVRLAQQIFSNPNTSSCVLGIG